MSPVAALGSTRRVRGRAMARTSSTRAWRCAGTALSLDPGPVRRRPADSRSAGHQGCRSGPSVAAAAGLVLRSLLFGASCCRRVGGAFAARSPSCSARAELERRETASPRAWPAVLEETRVLAGAGGHPIPHALFEAGRRAAARGPRVVRRRAARVADVDRLRPRPRSAQGRARGGQQRRRVRDPPRSRIRSEGTGVDRRLEALIDDRLRELDLRRDAMSRQAGARFARRFVLIVPVGMAFVGMSLGTGRAAYQGRGAQAHRRAGARVDRRVLGVGRSHPPAASARAGVHVSRALVGCGRGRWAGVTLLLADTRWALSPLARQAAHRRRCDDGPLDTDGTRQWLDRRSHDARRPRRTRARGARRPRHPSRTGALRRSTSTAIRLRQVGWCIGGLALGLLVSAAVGATTGSRGAPHTRPSRAGVPPGRAPRDPGVDAWTRAGRGRASRHHRAARHAARRGLRTRPRARAPRRSRQGACAQDLRRVLTRVAQGLASAPTPAGVVRRRRCPGRSPPGRRSSRSTVRRPISVASCRRKRARCGRKPTATSSPSSSVATSRCGSP